MSEVILPSILLLIAFCLKLFIDRTVDIPQTLKAICELPVDIMFLSMSFGVGYTISKNNSEDGLVFLFWSLLLSVFVIFIWKKSLFLLSVSGNRKYFWILLLSINLLFSGYTILYSVNLVTKDKIKKKAYQKEKSSKTISITNNNSNGTTK